jgi:hypothetical protein
MRLKKKASHRREPPAGGKENIKDRLGEMLNSSKASKKSDLAHGGEK